MPDCRKDVSSIHASIREPPHAVTIRPTGTSKISSIILPKYQPTARKSAAFSVLDVFQLPRASFLGVRLASLSTVYLRIRVWLPLSISPPALAVGGLG